MTNDFGIDREKDKTTASDQELTASWIRAAIENGFKAGLTSDRRRMMLKIVDDMAHVVETNAEYLEVNEVNYGFIKTAFQGAIMDPKFTLPMVIVEDAVFNAVDTLPVKEDKPMEEETKVEVTPEVTPEETPETTPEVAAEPESGATSKSDEAVA